MCASAPAILLIGNDPTEQHPLLAWNIRTNVRLNRAKLYVVNSQAIKLRRQATNFVQIGAGKEGRFVAFLNGDDAAAGSLTSASVTNDALKKLRDDLKATKDLVIIFGSEIRGTDVAALVKFAPAGAKFICLGDYANSRGAADMGVLPDLLPGYTAMASGAKFKTEWGTLPANKGLSISEMMQAAKDGKLAALYVVGSNPVTDYSFDPAALKNTFIVAQELFLTETASLADVVFPAASAYEKSGTFTNTSGDLQLLKKAGDLAGVRSDFEIIVRVSERMGADVRQLVPFGGDVRADMGQTRGAQSGEADRHSVWLAANNMETRLSPFDNMAILDEIQRLVPGYEFSRLNLLGGNEQHVTAAELSSAGAAEGLVQIVPANDTLFTSGTMGRYSKALNSVAENKRRTAPEVMAD